MTQARYVVSSLEGRVRLRHPLFRQTAIARRAQEIIELKGAQVQVNLVTGSLLIYYGPDCSLQELCSALEKEWPELSDVQTGVEKILPHVSHTKDRKLRTFENRSMLLLLALGLLCAGLGSERAHVATTASFLALCLRHIWARRRVL